MARPTIVPEMQSSPICIFGESLRVWPHIRLHLGRKRAFWEAGGVLRARAASGLPAPVDANELIVELPNTVGSYNLSLAMNATFYVASSSDNWVATRGRIVIDSISATTITGGANNGQFQVAVCP